MKSEQVRNKLVMKVGMPARIATIASPVGNGDDDGDDDDDANARKSWANIKEGGKPEDAELPKIPSAVGDNHYQNNLELSRVTPGAPTA